VTAAPGGFPPDNDEPRYFWSPSAVRVPGANARSVSFVVATGQPRSAPAPALAPAPARDADPPFPGAPAGGATATAAPAVGAAAIQVQAPARSALFDQQLEPAPPARWGWRGRVNRATGGRISLAAHNDEVQHHIAGRRLLHPFDHAVSIVVANPKGGAAKTPTTLMAAATLGDRRGGYTLAWDNNETRGTLGLRAEAAHHSRNVIDLLDDIDQFLHTSASVGAMAGYLRPQSAHFDVLASDDVPGRMEMIDDVAFGRLQEALSRFYRMLVIDTGNNVRAANWTAATSSADCLVVPTTVQRDVADTGLWMLDHVVRTGRPDLAANAVAIVSCADPVTDQGLLTEIVTHYRQVVREVVVIPFDPIIRAGGRISYDAVGLRTRRAWRLACAAIVDSLVGDGQDHTPPAGGD
jgi:MinD-like ATPase involved in chromosome partitioning or flagellar assembly